MIRLLATLIAVALVSLMSLVVEGVRAWLLVKPWKRFKAWRSRRRLAKTSWAEHHLDEIAEDFNSTDEVPMDVKAFLVQAVLATLRHAMTASPFAALVTDDWLVQTATILVGIGGYVWSLKRKVKPA